MEELLSTFVRSIFVDNMIFAYYLGMCSFLAVSKNVKTALGLGMAVTFILTCTLPINYMLENYVLKEGALQWLGAEFACFHYLYRHHRFVYAAGGNGSGKVCSGSVRFSGYLFAADRCKLRYPGWFSVYATKGIS